MGLFVPGVEVPNVDDDEADLEAELNQLMGGGGGHQAKKKAGKPPVKGKVADLDKMVAACMADDQDFDDGDVDDDDPDLLNELAQLEGGGEDISDDENFAGGNDVCPGGASLLATINERLGMYASAEAAAKQVIIKMGSQYRVLKSIASKIKSPGSTTRFRLRLRNAEKATLVVFSS